MLISWALAFAIAGFVARYLSQGDVETRYLILVFWLFVALLELVVRPAFGMRRNYAALILNGTAATIAIISMKWLIEGVPASLQLLFEDLRVWLS